MSTAKTCAISVRFYDPKIEKITCKLLHLAEIYNDNTSGATGENIFNIITNYLNENDIPKENLVVFASDGASSLMGPNNSVTSRLASDFPNITIIRCFCHSVYLCSSNAAKTLPRMCKDLLRNTYSHFSHSAKRIHEFSQFQEFCHLKPHKILHISQTRWLSLHAAVARILEKWEPLKLYFIHRDLEDRLETTSLISTTMADPSVKLYLILLKLILPKFNNLNLMFQKQEPTIHLLHQKCIYLYLDLLR